MKASELMTTDVQTCWTHDSLDRVAGLMWERDCGGLPVLDQNGTVVGMITDRDICMAALTQRKVLEQMPVSRAMSVRLISCRPDEELDEVEKKMRSHQVRRVPVVDDRGHLRGILSLADIAQRAGKDAKGKGRTKKVGYVEVGETLTAVTAPHRRAVAAAAS